MDLDWCLSCDQHLSVEGSVYCSEACRLSELTNSTTVSTPLYTLYSSQSSAEPSATSQSFYQPRHTSPDFTSMRSGGAFQPQPQHSSTSAPLQRHAHHQRRSEQAWMSSHQYGYHPHRQVQRVPVMI